MSARRKRSRASIARAVARLRTETLISVDEAARLCHQLGTNCSGDSIIRWIVQGRRGTHLDGLHRAGVGWLTSAEAVTRFLAATGGHVAPRVNYLEPGRKWPGG